MIRMKGDLEFKRVFSFFSALEALALALEVAFCHTLFHYQNKWVCLQDDMMTNG